MEPSHTYRKGGDKNCQSVKGGKRASAALGITVGNSLDHGENHGDDHVEEDEHPVFLPSCPAAEHRVFLHNLYIPLHAVFLSAYSTL